MPLAEVLSMSHSTSKNILVPRYRTKYIEKNVRENDTEARHTLVANADHGGNGRKDGDVDCHYDAQASLIRVVVVIVWEL